MSNYPLPKFHFKVEWGGSPIGVTEVSGLSFEVEVIEYREGLSKEYSPKLMPGKIKNNNITLKRGLVKGRNEFFEWINSAQLNKIERRDITISLLNEAHEPLVTWKIKNAFPVKLEWSELKADANEVAIETMELVHEGLTIEN